MSIFKNILIMGIFLALCFALFSINNRISKLTEQINAQKYVFAELSEKIDNLNPTLKAEKEELTSLLLVNNVFDENGPLKIERFGKEYDGGYVIPIKALEQADAVLGYGIRDDISFEEMFSARFNRPSYGFDCGKDININITNKLFTLVRECIGTDSSIDGGLKNSNGKVTSFTTELTNLNLNNKKLFVKMDIEGGEFSSFQEIMSYADNITGIAMELHILSPSDFQKGIELLKMINKNFVLTHVHSNNCATYNYKLLYSAANLKGIIPSVLELSFINKSLITKYEISNNQSHPTELDMPCNRNKDDIKFEVLR